MRPNERSAAEPPPGPTAAEPPSSPALDHLLRGPGFLLSTAGRLVRERFERALAPTGLRARHLGVLVALASEGPLPQGVSARRLGLDATTLVSIVDDLEYWGLVERRRNRTDRRAYRLTLTAAGARKLAEVAPFVEAEEWLAPLDEQERAQLQALLTRLLFGPDGWLADSGPPSAAQPSPAHRKG